MTRHGRLDPPRAISTWIQALALVAGAGLWSTAHAQVGIQASIDIDNTGAARIAYFDLHRGGLEFLSRSPTTGAWTSQRVDFRGGTGLNPALADSLNNPAIAYYDQANGDLMYAKRLAGVWTTHRVDAAGDVGSFCSLKFASTGPAISYFDVTNGDLKFARWTVSGWTTEVVESAGTVGQFSSLGFDINAQPVIAYYDATNAALKFATRTGGNWVIETVSGSGGHCSLAVDGFFGPRISFFDGIGSLKYASKSGGVWTIQTVDAGPGVGHYSSVRLDNARRARIAYYDFTNGDLKLASQLTLGGTSWNLEAVDAAGDVGRSASLALDLQGNPHVCGYRVNGGEIRYGAYTFGRWRVETADAQNRAGRFNSLAMDAQRVAHVGYFDVIHGRLMYARRDPAGWALETVDSAPQAGQYVSIALASEPRLSYYVATEGQLRYAERSGGVWSVQVVDATGIAGMFTSLALENGNPRIAYFDARNEALKYAFRNGGTWTVETVEAGPGVGLHASLSVVGGIPRIAYYDALRGDLKLATRSGTSWTTEIVEAAGNVGPYASLVIDGSGVRRIAYHDGATFAPRYAESGGGPWNVEAADTAGTGGLFTSLALDASGTPHIVYYNEPVSSLRHAARTAGSWTAPRETVDNNGNVGRFASLAIDVTDSLSAVYYDATGHDLKYAVLDASNRWVRENLDGEFPRINVWSMAGAFQDNTLDYIGTTVCAGLVPPRPDSLRPQARALTVRFLRDRRIEARPDFGGYRIYRVTQDADTARMELVRRFSRQRNDFLGWYMSIVDTNDVTLAFECGGEVAHDSVVTFVDPDSNGHYEKFCPELLNNRCVKDSVWRLVAPPGPHDGIPTYYAVTIEARNSGLEGTYEDLYVPGREPDTRNNYALCTTPNDPATCPRVNLNHKSQNITPRPGAPRLEPTAGPAPDLEQVLVVPNPYRAQEVWDQPGAHEVHFINLPQKATVRIYTVAGDLVAELQHNDPVRDFLPWNLKNGKGNDVASGIYIYRIESPQCTTCVPPVPVAFSHQSRLVVIR